MTMQLMTAREVSDTLGLPEERIYSLAREGILPHVRIGRSVRFSREQLDDWIRQGGQASPGGWKRNA